MKTIKRITYFLFVFVSIANAQEVENQTQKLATIKQGNYTSFLTHKEGNKYKGGMENLDYVVKDIQDYKIQPGAHKEVYYVDGESPERRDSQTAYMYLPDNEAFAVTYIQRSYEGNKELQEEIGYVQRVNRHADDNRLVFLDGRIYVIKDWVDKDDFTLHSVLEFEEKELNAFKMMKASMKSPKKMEAMQPHETLQDYLDKATKKQEEFYASWIKTPANKALIQNQEAKAKLMSSTITKMSEDWRNSDEYKRIQQNNRLAEQRANESNVTVVNKTGKRINIREAGSGGSSSLYPGSSGTYDCKRDIYYKYDSGNINLSDIKTKFYNANQSCGGTVTVN